MDWINYHHLYYFWVVAKEKSISKATKKLLIAQPTISAQLKSLEASAGCLLFDRSGKGVKLTKEGEVVFAYAKKIFEIGHELRSFLTGSQGEIQQTIRVGIENHIPKILSFNILNPMFKSSQNLKLLCVEDDISNLVQKLLSDDIDFILSGREIIAYKSIKVVNHLIGSSGIVWLGSRVHLTKQPDSASNTLGKVPLILPSDDAELRSAVEKWFVSHRVRPHIVAEIQDTALMKVFAADGLGVFPLSDIVAKKVKQQYRLEVIASTPEIKQKLYLVSMEKKLRTPAIKLIFDSARSFLVQQ